MHISFTPVPLNVACEKGRNRHGRTLACGFSSSSLKLRHAMIRFTADFTLACEYPLSSSTFFFLFFFASYHSLFVFSMHPISWFLYFFTFPFRCFLSVCPSVSAWAAAHISSILFAIALLNYTLNIFSLL